MSNTIEIGRNVDKIAFETFYELEAGTKQFKIFKGNKNQKYLVEDFGDTYLIRDTYKEEELDEIARQLERND